MATRTLAAPAANETLAAVTRRPHVPVTEPSPVASATSPSIEVLSAQLDSGPIADRRAAAHALLARGPCAIGALPTLTRTLEDSDDELRRTAVLGIGVLGPASRSVRPRLVAMLEDPSARSAVVEALRHTGREDIGAALVQVALGPDKEGRAAACELLRSWSRAVPELVRRSSATGERALLLEAFGHLDAADTTIALVAALEDEELAAGAEDALSARGPAVAAAVRVVASLESTNPRLRGRGGRVLHAWGPDAMPLALDHAARRYDQERTRRLLGDALRAIGPERCAPFVSGLWNDDDVDPVVRKEVAEALRILDATTAAPLVEAVVAVIQSTTRAARPLDYATLMLVTERAPEAAGPLLARAVRDPTLCHYAGPSLQALGKDAVARAVPELRLAVRGAEPGPRGPALTLLAYLGVADTATIASDVLGDRTSPELTRRGAARILGELGEAARASLPALICALDDPALSLRQDVIAALVRLGPVADGGAPELVERLADPDVGLDVALLLVRMARGLDEVAPVLVKTLTSDPDDERRVSAARVLGSLPDATAAASVPALARAVMSDASQRVRQAAINSLGALGSLAVAARPALESKASDEAEPHWLRAEATEAAAALLSPRRPTPPQRARATPTPAEAPRGWLGVRLQAKRERLADGRDVQGATIVDVVPDGPAAASGLLPGDVIVALDGADARGVPDVQTRIGSAGAGTSIRFRVLRRVGAEPPSVLEVGVTLGHRERP